MTDYKSATRFNEVRWWLTLGGESSDGGQFVQGMGLAFKQAFWLGECDEKHLCVGPEVEAAYEFFIAFYSVGEPAQSRTFMEHHLEGMTTFWLESFGLVGYVNADLSSIQGSDANNASIPTVTSNWFRYGGGLAIEPGNHGLSYVKLWGVACPPEPSSGVGGKLGLLVGYSIVTFGTTYAQYDATASLPKEQLFTLDFGVRFPNPFGT